MTMSVRGQVESAEITKIGILMPIWNKAVLYEPLI